ncbi:MGMT family protein [Vulgatibacter incomptus]|uniref:Methylated-DNA-[protein]-cysteine S-methyltransferase family protein n=1 Tax=Vulgatibacter incomptus TaxID=1391653 RepID=A0A0K1PID5_9BACT|nr:MGMT family protein [Vulgatibacter incomptus]AKU93262.1 Methylated-DNA-[protein]-cysteine S-methyltransferase family protein [Vulgatibacter incomptus]
MTKDAQGFDAAVAAVVRAIPRGQVLSYGQVAARAGNPKAARAVARSLGRSSGIPWWRVVRADRTLAGAVADPQARLLEAEGVRIEGRRIVATASDR